MFAKLFGTDDDQVLVVIQEGDEGPAIQISCVPPGLGVCTTTLNYPYSAYPKRNAIEKAWDTAEAAFARMDEAAARRIADGLKKQVAAFDTT